MICVDLGQVYLWELPLLFYVKSVQGGRKGCNWFRWYDQDSNQHDKKVITNLLRRVEEQKKKEADLKEELKKKEAHMCEELKKKEAHMCKELKKKEAYLSKRLGISISVNVVFLFIMCIMILQFV